MEVAGHPTGASGRFASDSRIFSRLHTVASRQDRQGSRGSLSGGLYCFMLVMLLPLTLHLMAGQDAPSSKLLVSGGTATEWRGYRLDRFPDASWALEGDMLMTLVEGPRVDLVTTGEYEDFDLALEWKAAPGANSGIFFNVVETYPAAPHSGPEYQILSEPDHGRPPLHWSGALYDLIAPTADLTREGDFNESRIRVQEGHVEFWLNGVRTVEFQLGSSHLSDLIRFSKFAQRPAFARARKGHIALQHHGGQVWFRNIRLRRLPPREQGR